MSPWMAPALANFTGIGVLDTSNVSGFVALEITRRNNVIAHITGSTVAVHCSTTPPTTCSAVELSQYTVARSYPNLTLLPHDAEA